jgi:hypothetical protein
MTAADGGKGVAAFIVPSEDTHMVGAGLFLLDCHRLLPERGKGILASLAHALFTAYTAQAPNPRPSLQCCLSHTSPHDTHRQH